MDTSKLADIAEIVSSVAIIVTLIFLTVEVRQNTEALHAESRQSVLTSAQVELFALVEDPNILISMVKPNALTPQEHVKLHSFLVAVMRAREFSWLQYKNGIIDERQWSTERTVALSILEPRRNRTWWNKMGQKLVSSEYAAFMNELLQDQPPTDETYMAITNWTNL